MHIARLTLLDVLSSRISGKLSYVCSLHVISSEVCHFYRQSAEWEDSQAEKDMGDLLTVRSAILSLLEKARGAKYVLKLCVVWLTLILLRNLKSALEAQVVITLPPDPTGLELVALLRREGEDDAATDRICLPRTAIANFLKTLFIVSDVTLSDKRSAASAAAWEYSGSLTVPGLPGCCTRLPGNDTPQ